MPTRNKKWDVAENLDDYTPPTTHQSSASLLLANLRDKKTRLTHLINTMASLVKKRASSPMLHESDRAEQPQRVPHDCFVFGFVNAVKKIVTKNQETMAFVDLRSLSEDITIIVSPRILSCQQNLWTPGTLLIVAGRLRNENGDLKMFPVSAHRLTPSDFEDIVRVNGVVPEHAQRAIENFFEDLIGSFLTPLYREDAEFDARFGIREL